MVDVILPALDEAEALRWLLPRMPAGFHPIVVDNGSGDETAAVAAALGATVVEERQRGFGAACWRGLVAARDDVVCFMDADGSLDPLDLRRVALGVREGRDDLVLGARQPERGSWPVIARLGNRSLARRLRRATGVPLTDLGPMRSARRVDLLALGIVDRRFGWPLEMVVRASRAGWRITEVPVPYTSRRGGRSKVTGTPLGTLRTIRDMTGVLRSVVA